MGYHCNMRVVIPDDMLIHVKSVKIVCSTAQSWFCTLADASLVRGIAMNA
jgi:hypothetical protein